MVGSATGLPSPPESAISDNATSPSKRQQQQQQQQQSQQQTGPYLEDLSRAVLEVMLNQKDSQHPLVLKHLAVGFRSKHDVLKTTNTRADHQGNLTEHLASQPNLSVDILNATSEVDEWRGRATVYLWYCLSGVTEAGFEREAMAVLSWERRQGLWQIIKHAGMRGPSGFS